MVSRFGRVSKLEVRRSLGALNESGARGVFIVGASVSGINPLPGTCFVGGLTLFWSVSDGYYATCAW